MKDPRPSIATPDHVTLIKAIVRIGPPARASILRNVIFEGSYDMGPQARAPYDRAIDRSLQSARKEGLIVFDSKQGWVLTAKGMNLL